MTRHTPGPWEVVGDHYISADSEYVAMVDESTVSEDEMRANVRLIVAAPELLFTLKLVRMYCPIHVQDGIDKLVKRIEGRK